MPVFYVTSRQSIENMHHLLNRYFRHISGWFGGQVEMIGYWYRSIRPRQVYEEGEWFKWDWNINMLIVSSKNRKRDSISKYYFHTRQVLRLTYFKFRITLKSTSFMYMYIINLIIIKVWMWRWGKWPKNQFSKR